MYKSAVVVDGRVVSKKIMSKVKAEVEGLKKQNIEVCLAVVLVGNNPASKIYIKNKKKACEEVGIVSKELIFPEDISEKELIDVVEKLNTDETVNGILVQFPLPKSIYEIGIIQAISPFKDVDGFHPVNVGKLFMGQHDCLLPCTPCGVLNLIEEIGLDISGKNCVIVGRSNIVGKPLAGLLLKKNATVTICHSKTVNVEKFTKEADVLIVAVGRPNFIKAEMVKKGATVIDVGINRLSSGKLCGDVDFFEVSSVAGHITPVPGGVGPMTIAKLMENSLLAAKLQNGLN